MKKYIVVLVGLCLLTCDSENREPSPEVQLSSEGNEVLSYIESLGFSMADTKDMGDILILAAGPSSGVIAICWTPLIKRILRSPLVRV
jgi:hypothetical protein